MLRPLPRIILAILAVCFCAGCHFYDALRHQEETPCRSCSKDEEIEFKPTALSRRWFIFCRRGQLRELGPAFYRPENPTQPYFIQSCRVPVDGLDKDVIFGAPKPGTPMLCFVDAQGRSASQKISVIASE